MKEAAASGWRHRRWLHWHRRRETLQFLLSFFSLISAVRDSFSSDPLLLLPLLFCRGGPARGNLRFRKNSLPSGSGHGEKVFWGGCGAAAGKCATKIYGVSYERDQGGKDQLTEVTGNVNDRIFKPAKWKQMEKSLASSVSPQTGMDFPVVQL